jgi:hypothetical protein
METLTAEQKLVLAESLLDHVVKKQNVTGLITILAHNFELLGIPELPATIRGMGKAVHSVLSRLQEQTGRASAHVYTISDGSTYTIEQLIAIAEQRVLTEPIAKPVAKPVAEPVAEPKVASPYVIPASECKSTHWVADKEWLYVGADGIDYVQIYRGKGTLVAPIHLTAAMLMECKEKLAEPKPDGSYTAMVSYNPHIRVNFKLSK